MGESGRVGGAGPDLAKVLARVPSSPTAGEEGDAAAFRRSKLGQRLRRWATLQRRRRPHPVLLEDAVREVLRHVPEPTCIETGCLRDIGEGTDSTLVIARTLAGRGRFFTFELEAEHLRVCREALGEHGADVRFVEGDSAANLRRLREAGELPRIDFAFLDSGDDPDLIAAELDAIADALPPGALVIVDDVVRGVKGRRVKPRLHEDPRWETHVVHGANGLLVAAFRGPA